MASKTEVFGLDTQSLTGALQLRGIDSDEWCVKALRVKDSPAVLERDVYFTGETPFFWGGFKSIFSQSKEPVQVTELRDYNIRFWSRDAVYYLAAFNPFLIEINEDKRAGGISTEPQKYRKSVSDFFKAHYEKYEKADSDMSYSTPSEDGVGILLEGFALGGDPSKVSEVSASIKFFREKRPGQKSFALFLEANKIYWLATKIDAAQASAMIEDAFKKMGFSSGDFVDNANKDNACTSVNLLEEIAEENEMVCASSENRTSFDLAMIQMFTELDDRQDVLLKWLVRHMVELYGQPVILPSAIVPAPEQVVAAVAKPAPKVPKVAPKKIKRDIPAPRRAEVLPPPVPEEEVPAPVEEAPAPRSDEVKIVIKNPELKAPEQKWRRPQAFE